MVTCKPLVNLSNSDIGPLLHQQQILFLYAYVTPYKTIVDIFHYKNTHSFHSLFDFFRRLSTCSDPGIP